MKLPFGVKKVKVSISSTTIRKIVRWFKERRKGKKRGQDLTRYSIILSRRLI